MPQKSLILNPEQITHIINRMSLQILEQNMDEEEIVLAGIKERGYEFAALLKKQMESFSDKKINLIPISLNKKNPILADFEGQLKDQYKSIVVVDDVANTGKTLLYAIRPLLELKINKIEIAVLVDRQHKLFPVVSNYIGHQVSTTIKENITVDIVKGKVNVYLS